jgi:mRNA-degrading endonuclease toxin of MazEF toxin-antitoxin module
MRTKSGTSMYNQITDVELPGTLRHKSKIKADTVASLEQSILIKQIARLRASVFQQVITTITDLIRLP